MKIDTVRKSNSKGTAQILAKGGGKQKTVNYDHEHSPSWNHGNAAGELALVLFQGETSRKVAAQVATHKETIKGHTFTFNI